MLLVFVYRSNLFVTSRRTGLIVSGAPLSPPATRPGASETRPTLNCHVGGHDQILLSLPMYCSDRLKLGTWLIEGNRLWTIDHP
jgi:hypothetical protein